MILAIDTATEFAGLALSDADTVWVEEIWHAVRNHTVEVMPRLNRMLRRAGVAVAALGGIAVSIGPGSYTGVRIAVAIAKGLALPHNIPVIGVPTLAVTAYPHRNQNLPVIAIAQAGRRRILAAHYQWIDQVWKQTSEPALTTVTQLGQTLADPALITGELKACDAAYLAEEIQGKLHVVASFDRVRRPSVLAELGRVKLADSGVGDLDQLIPVYLSGP